MGKGNALCATRGIFLTLFNDLRLLCRDILYTFVQMNITLKFNEYAYS